MRIGRPRPFRAHGGMVEGREVAAAQSTQLRLVEAILSEAEVLRAMANADNVRASEQRLLALDPSEVRSLSKGEEGSGTKHYGLRIEHVEDQGVFDRCVT